MRGTIYQLSSTCMSAPPPSLTCGRHLYCLSYNTQTLSPTRNPFKTRRVREGEGSEGGGREEGERERGGRGRKGRQNAHKR